MTDQPEPTGNGQEPKFTFPAINQTITYHDGSSIQIIVNSRPEENMDDATRAYAHCDTQKWPDLPIFGKETPLTESK